MKKVPDAGSMTSSEEYDALLAALYLKVKRQVEEILVPPLPVLAVTGNEPPASPQFQAAVGALYSVGYGLKMGLKFGKLPQPARYFDYRVGALEALWWSTGDRFDISDPATLRWQAYLMVPWFVTAELVAQARTGARAKHPETNLDEVQLTRVDEGRAVQVLHVGPYDREQPTIAALHAHAAALGLKLAGAHHEIYLSDPRRTAPEKLKTVIRQPVR